MILYYHVKREDILRVAGMCQIMSYAIVYFLQKSTGIGILSYNKNLCG